MQYLWIQVALDDGSKEARPFTYNRMQRHLIPNLTGQDIIVKPRQGGISTALQGRLNRRAWTETVSVATLAHDDATTQRLRRMSRFFWQSLPADVRPARQYDNAWLTMYPGTQSEVVIQKAGTTTGGRGFTLSEAHLSEAAFYANLEAILTGLAEAGRPRLTLESSANGAQGYFYHLVMGGIKNENNWKIHFYQWWWDDRNCIPLEPGEVLKYEEDEEKLVRQHGLTPDQIKWRRKKKRDLPRTFEQEYPEDIETCFLKSGVGYFGDIAAAFKVQPGSRKPVQGHRYVAGLDFGQQTDFTALSIIDATTMEEVDLLRVNRLSWEEMRRRVREKCKIWRPYVVYAEKNAMGTTNIEALNNELYADGLGTIPIVGFDMTPYSKPPLMASLHAAINELGLALYDDPIHRDEFNSAIAKQTSRGWTVVSPRDIKKDGNYSDESIGHGDTVVGTALAYHGVIFVR